MNAGIGLQFAIAYVLSFLVYQIGTVITTSAVGEGFAAGLIAVAGIITVVAILSIRSNAKTRKEYAGARK